MDGDFIFLFLLQLVDDRINSSRLASRQYTRFYVTLQQPANLEYLDLVISVQLLGLK